MAQIGVMMFYLLPMAIKLGSSSIVGIPLAALISVSFVRLFQGKKIEWFWPVKVLLAVGLAAILLYDLSNFAMDYIGIKKGHFLVMVGILLLANIGRKWEEHDMSVPGEMGLRRIWAKALLVVLALLLLFQIKNIVEGGCWPFDKIDFGKSIEGGILFFFLDVPYFFMLEKEEKVKNRACLKQVILWMSFFALFLVLEICFEREILLQSKIPFLALSRSAVGFRGEPIRLEIPAAMFLWVAMFFGIWECVNVIYREVGRKFRHEKNNRD